MSGSPLTTSSPSAGPREAAPGEALVRLEDVAYRWPGAVGAQLALEHFNVAAGEHVFVSGPSGSGKSTLLGLLAGVLVPQRGTVSIQGNRLDTMSAGKRDRFRAHHVGIIFQQLNLLPYLSVIDNVLLACRFSNQRRARTCDQGDSPESAAAMLLTRLDLEPALWRRSAATLSIGQQQRVAAARALLGRPQLVLADEPTSALDAPRQSAFMDLLQRECRAAGASLVFVSHDDRLATRFDRRFALAGANGEAG